MPTRDSVERDAALTAAEAHARAWLKSQDTRNVPAAASFDEMVAALGPQLPAGPTSAEDVVDLLATAGGPGLVASPSGRFYGFVIGGTHPAALGADWLVSAWDQNAGLNVLSPTAAAAEHLAAVWLLDLLGLPASSAVGFVTGATMSNFTCLAAARNAVLRKAGWDVAAEGLNGAPRVRVLVGAERHDTVDLALQYLGLGQPEPVAADTQGRIDPAALEAALSSGPDGPVIVALQAGNVHSGGFDPFGTAIDIAHRYGAWVHIDGAFGLFAAASPRLRHLTAGYEDADSWTTDAHKTLNVPYDCGIAIVREPAALRTAMGTHAAYLVEDAAGDAHDVVPEFSRRARGVPVWAVLRALGRDGTAALVEQFVDHARAFAHSAAEMDGATVLNDVDFTQVCVSFGSDERTQDVVRRMMEDGTAWMTGSRWRDRAVLRISVSNWSTTDEDVARSVEALRRAALA